jgi:hypothetical protein
MAGIIIASKTIHNTIMLRLINNGQIIDRLEVNSLIFLTEEEIAGMSESELQLFIGWNKTPSESV